MILVLINGEESTNNLLVGTRKTTGRPTAVRYPNPKSQQKFRLTPDTYLVTLTMHDSKIQT